MTIDILIDNNIFFTILIYKETINLNNICAIDMLCKIPRYFKYNINKPTEK